MFYHVVQVMPMQLTHTRLLVTDFPMCFRFYRDTLGLPVQMGEESGPYAEFQAGSTTLALFPRGAMAEAIGDAEKPLTVVGQDRVALIFEVDDVDAELAQLRGKGVEITAEPQDRPGWGIRTAHLRDPDGTLIEIYQDLLARH